MAALVPAATLEHPDSGAIWLAVNGADRQRADLADKIWPVKNLVSFISKSVRLKAGDLIFTGTPAGADSLKPGDVVRGGIDGIDGIGEFAVAVGE